MLWRDVNEAMSFSQQFLIEVQEIAKQLETNTLERLAAALREVREREGRLFILGVGGSAANASHAVNDFRKITGIEAYAPTDNVSELTARTNDEGWATVFDRWLRVDRKSTRLNSSHMSISYAVFCLKKKNKMLEVVT